MEAARAVDLDILSVTSRLDIIFLPGISLLSWLAKAFKKIVLFTRRHKNLCPKWTYLLKMKKLLRNVCRQWPKSIWLSTTVFNTITERGKSTASVLHSSGKIPKRTWNFFFYILSLVREVCCLVISGQNRKIKTDITMFSQH